MPKRPALRAGGIPYVDIGLRVRSGSDEKPVLGGQVILSMPGRPCMRCLNFLTDSNLAQEAADYGAGGGREQVGWSNGALAAAAVGIGVNLVTGWTTEAPIYLMYNGNENTLKEHPRLQFLPGGGCYHFGLDDIGDPLYKDI